MVEAGYWVLVLAILACGIEEFRICRSTSNPLPKETPFERDMRLRLHRDTKRWAWVDAGIASVVTAVKLWG